MIRKFIIPRLVARREAAQAEYSAAQARGDTRGMSRALVALRDATHALMRWEGRCWI